MDDQELKRLTDVLSLLEHGNDEHWTSDGLPKIEFVNSMMEGVKVTREEVTNAAPLLKRESENPVPKTLTPEDVLAMKPADVFQDEGLTRIAQKALIEKAARLNSEMAGLQSQLNSANAFSAMCSRRIIQFERAGPQVKSNQNIIDYLARQNEMREERSKRIRAMHESGLDAQELAKMFNPASG